MAEEQRKAELTAELARARRRIGANLGALRHDLDFPARVKSAVMKNPTAWLGGVVIVGALLAALPGRRKKIVVSRKTEAHMANAGKAGLLLGALKIAFDLARPALAKWASRRVADYMDGRGKGGPVSR